ncbi:IclR family transcriptional regulator [Mycolicibacterium tokaiense]|jgi:IclR family acetate operon transcriptional repressor|uniref:Transcriptional regulator IclR n=1 Tax=Mycolicibacterium tokaiense TaxID=39695 RepID=A0A378TD51_9MYCO|nr:IclR family transcriptional regulator [Mycolicibacterium tokaiense]ANW62898.1 IclR family transcriptional regulator [Mycobacterium sp. djl-10]STZ58752.1 transcriptional regulator IclR [Mycolicibacterium tokaiense]
MVEDGSVRVIERVCLVLDCFTKQQPRLQVGDIRDRTGLPATTVARILKNLVAQRLLEREGNDYRLGLRVLVWSAPAKAASDLIMAAGPVIDHVRDLTGETTGVYVRQGAVRVGVAATLSERSIIYNGYVGQVMPMHAGAAGKTLMAFSEQALSSALDAGLTRFTDATITDAAALRRELETVRAQGWAYASEEREPGLSSIAAPILDSAGEITATITVGGPTFRLSPAAAAEFGPLIAAAGISISQRLGYVGHLADHPAPTTNGH